MQFDPLSDAFTQIFNAEQAGHYEVTVNPASKMLGSMLSIMQSSGYVGEYQNCLLYTSPSPRDRSLSRMPSSA